MTALGHQWYEDSLKNDSARRDEELIIKFIWPRSELNGPHKTKHINLNCVLAYKLCDLVCEKGSYNLSEYPSLINLII